MNTKFYFPPLVSPISLAILLFFVGTVVAQEPAVEEEQIESIEGEPEQDETSEDDNINKRNVEEMVVTGSRIKRTEFSSTAPIEVITTDRSVLAGLLNSADILQGSTFASGQQIDDSFSAFVTDGGPGANEISLRGLGGQRTLVLVNGKRWMPSGVRGGTNSVDLTALPSTIINRYEILKDGASSVYGADAVAGVINAITRTSLDGGRVTVSAVHGDEYGIETSWGKTGGNWSFSFSGQFTHQANVKQSELDYAKCDTRPRLTDQDGDGKLDNRDPVTGEELCFGFIYGFLAATPAGFLRYDPSLANPDPSNPRYDELINGNFGVPFFTRAPANDLENAEGAVYRDLRTYDVQDVQSERKLLSFNSLGNYDFSIADRSASAYYELYYNQRETVANPGYGQFFPSVPVDNPYNPFGPAALGASAFGSVPVLPSYNLISPEFNVDIERVQYFQGIKGDISATWTYDAYVGYGYSDGTYGGQNFLANQVNQSLSAVVDGDGNIACRDLANNPGCVPMNLFTQDALLGGRLPQNVLDYIVADTEGHTIYKGYTLSAYATGELFSLPAGEVSAVFGAEFRSETIRDKPDEESIKGNIFNATAAGITAGSDKVREFYTEFEVPLLDGLPGFEELTANVSGRYTDYDSFGDDTTYRGTLNWQMIPWLRLRSTMGTSFRAPDLFERFLGDETGFVDGNVDPCKRYREDFKPGDPVYDNCDSLNLPDVYFTGARGITVVTGGADRLMAETSDSTTYGLVLQPEDWGLSVSINWFDISIENTVASLGATSLLGQCYTSISFASPFCQRIGSRDANGDIQTIDASFINIGEQSTKGYDVDVLYEHSFPIFDLSIDLTATYLASSSQELLGEETRYERRLAFPKWNGESDVRIDWKSWRFNWRINWIGDSGEEPVFDPGTTNVDRIVSTSEKFYHNLSAEYDGGEWTLVGVVRNVLGDDPPLIADGSGSLTAARVFNTIPGAGYPLLGRQFVLRASYEF